MSPLEHYLNNKWVGISLPVCVLSYTVLINLVSRCPHHSPPPLAQQMYMLTQGRLAPVTYMLTQ